MDRYFDKIVDLREEYARISIKSYDLDQFIVSCKEFVEKSERDRKGGLPLIQALQIGDLFRVPMWLRSMAGDIPSSGIPKIATNKTEPTKRDTVDYEKLGKEIAKNIPVTEPPSHPDPDLELLETAERRLKELQNLLDSVDYKEKEATLNGIVVVTYIQLYSQGIMDVWPKLLRQVPRDYAILPDIVMHHPRTAADVIEIRTQLHFFIEDYKKKLVRDGKLPK